MSYSIRIHPDRRIAVFHFSGVLNPQVGKQAFLDYIRMPDFDPHFAMLTDARQLNGVEASFPEIVSGVMKVMRNLRQFDQPVRSVILVNSEKPFVVARLLDQVLERASKIRIHIAREEHEALALVGCSDTDFARLANAA
ncbi:MULTISPECIES: hypothetical protein [Maritimibacter]|uniref:hypothetical protein n=1 Tax=Maritimibacter TaxID=404235 RepID=UPI00030B249D|nr:MULTISPECIES: hypothetical protein [Maritimibacter]MBL6427404.1 hypothetical protein [Maritimibacter sp.]TYP82641.1 hypothetical protein BD830_104524 [Maritimibacter alkaliphilus HTCC2654]